MEKPWALARAVFEKSRERGACWSCAFHKIGGDTFLGECRWFERKGEKPKRIPADVVDVGCKLWQGRPEDDEPREVVP